MGRLVLRLVVLATALFSSSADARHAEELYVRPLPHAHKTLAHFHFATREPLSTPQLTPPALRQILTKYDAAALRLSFSVGHYDHARYGPSDGATATRSALDAPFGARLQVTFHGGDLVTRWKGVTSELGGIFSASLNQMDETTVAGALVGTSVAELGALEALNVTTADAQFVQASLAREELCTENLTPWLKMLPCRAHVGLGALIDPIRILSGEYAMLSISAARVDGEWRVDQRLTTVQSSAGETLAALLLEGPDSSDAAVVACPLADKSTIVTESEPDATTLDLKSLVEPLSTTQRTLPSGTKDAAPLQPPPPENPVSVHRFQTGYGQVHGGLAVRLENRDAKCSQRVTYNDISPWYLRLYFHTFQTRLTSLDTGRVLEGDATHTPRFTFVPAELRGRPNQFRVEVELPPRSTLVLSVQFDKVFVRLSEHPPDANRGFDIPSGVATFTPIASGTCAATIEPRVVYSEPLLVALPTPDFSMPYNVITLTSTVVAFFAGSMLNTLLRKAPRIQRILATAEAKTP